MLTDGESLWDCESRGKDADYRRIDGQRLSTGAILSGVYHFEHWVLENLVSTDGGLGSSIPYPACLSFISRT